MEQWVSEVGEVLLLLADTPDCLAAVAGVMLLRGRGWYSYLCALQGSTAPALPVVITTDAADPNLQHAERLGLRAATELAPSDPRVLAWARWLASLPVGATGSPQSHSTAACRTEEPVPARVRSLLMSKGLTRRETEIALLAWKGLRNAEIGRQLFLGEPTVKGTLRRAYHKLGVTRRTGLRALLQ